MERRPIAIRNDGKWYFDGAEMFRLEIVNLLAANTHRDDDGNYYIRLGEDVNPLIVEDVPFLAVRCELLEDGGIKLFFHDLQEFVLTEPVKLGFKGDTPYVTYKWTNDTRLSRGVYWRLSKYFHFEGDEVFVKPGQPAEAE